LLSRSLTPLPRDATGVGWIGMDALAVIAGVWKQSIERDVRYRIYTIRTVAA
jgi:hypothetical protein